MPQIRPNYLRTVTEPVRPPAGHVPVRDQTLKTLTMLKNMDYKDVWCMAREVDALTIERAAQIGWCIGDVAEGRIKFTLMPQTPGSMAVADPPVEHPPRTTRASSFTRGRQALEPVQEGDTSPWEQTAPLAWSRQLSAQGYTPERRNSPAIVVTTPMEERDGFPFGTFADSAGPDDDWVPPDGSWMHRRQSQSSSVGSIYSQRDSDGPFYFDDDDIDNSQTRSRRGSNASTQSNSSLRRSNAFRAPTPELRINQGARTSNTASLSLMPARPAFQLQRLASAPALGSHPTFSLAPAPEAGWGDA